MAAMISPLLATAKTMIIGLFSRPEGISWLRYAACTFLRSQDRNVTSVNLKRKPGPSTVENYNSFAKKRKFTPVIVPLEHGAEAVWLGTSKSKYVILYFHGGAYRIGALLPHFGVLQRLIDALSDQGHDVSVMLVAYSLLHEAQYPTQLKQACSALQYLLQEANIEPENIIIAGDSAGGNLSLALLSHLTHPHPSCPAINLRDRKLLGTFLISPWVKFEHTSPRAVKNSTIDMIPTPKIPHAAELFLGNTKEDNYTTPILASADWWQGCPVSNMLFLGGGYETFVESIEDIAGVWKVHNPETEIFIAPYEIHVQCVVDYALKYPRPATEEHLMEWLLQILK